MDAHGLAASVGAHPCAQGWKWKECTAPWSALDDPDAAARFVVEQVGDKDFRIPRRFGFQYNAPDKEAIKVTKETLPTTDFASIPRFMSWLVGRHGRHTPAALVHDVLVVDGMSYEDRKAADLLFRDMLDALEVPPVLGRSMWAAATMATRWHASRTRIGICAWAVSAVLGLGLLARGAFNGTLWMVLVALIAPVAAASFWGDQFPAGLVAGLALPVVAGPAVVSLVGYWIYWVIERAVKVVRARLPANRKKAKELPDPAPFLGGRRRHDPSK